MSFLGLPSMCLVSPPALSIPSIHYGGWGHGAVEDLLLGMQEVSSSVPNISSLKGPGKRWCERPQTENLKTCCQSESDSVEAGFICGVNWNLASPPLTFGKGPLCLPQKGRRQWCRRYCPCLGLFWPRVWLYWLSSGELGEVSRLWPATWLSQPVLHRIAL